jgi:class 3 adenylate cyclase
VTFLFTDIEGSTRRWEADAAAMRVALSEHDKVLRDAIEEHDGFIFSHTGDGVVAAFASPRSAVDAAVKAQLALELPVRMGIATGEAELRDGDYFGTVLNRAARVMDVGDQTYESLARKGETMTLAEMVNFAYDQIDQARTELKASSK